VALNGVRFLDVLNLSITKAADVHTGNCHTSEDDKRLSSGVKKSDQKRAILSSVRPQTGKLGRDQGARKI